MRRFILTTLLLVVGVGTMCAQVGTNQSHSLKIYVTPLEGSDQALANMVTAKLIGRLAKHGLSVVESEEDADAILTGAGLMQASTTDYGHVRYRLHAGMRLVSKSGAVIWGDDLASGKYAQSASSSFAENVAKSLEEALSSKSNRNSN